MKNIETQALAKQAGDKFFSVSFVKKDGSLRKMNCRLGVKKHLRGGESTTAHCPNILTVFDVEKGQYRNINTETIQSVSVNGKKYDKTQWKKAVYSGN